MTDRVRQRYGTVAVFLHWTMALLIMGNIAIGLADGKLVPIAVHKSIGLTVLMLAAARIAWRLGHRPPPFPDTLAPLQRRLATGVHLLLYALMLIVPLTGWMFVSNAPRIRPLSWFGLFPLPYLTLGPTVYAPAKTAHQWLGIAFGVLAAGHVAAAIWHRIREQDHYRGRMGFGSPAAGART